MKRDMDLIDRFLAEDEDGNRYEVLIFQTMIISQNRAGTFKTPGMMSAQTSDGIALNFIDDDTFELFDSGKRIRKLSD